MLSLNSQELKLLSQNSDAQAVTSFKAELVSLEHQKFDIENTIRRLQEEKRQIEQKMVDTAFSITKAGATLREIQVAFIKGRGLDPGDLPITIRPESDGTGTVIIG